MSRGRDFEHEPVNLSNRKPEKKSSIFGGSNHDRDFAPAAAIITALLFFLLRS